MKEIWKDIQGYEGLYQVSNLGQIKSLRRVTTDGKIREERIMTGTYTPFGYKQVGFYKDGKQKNLRVHRIVAETFIPNPENKKCIDHIDTNASNNCVNNLRWVTQKENMNNLTTKKKKKNTVVKLPVKKNIVASEDEIWKDVEGYEGRYKISNKGHLLNIRKNYITDGSNSDGYLRVTLTSDDGSTKSIMIHRLVANAFIPNPEHKTFIDHIDTIRSHNCVENLRWATTKENMHNSLTMKKRQKKINQYSLDGTFVKTWPSAKKIKEETGIPTSSLSNCCRGKRYTYKGYIWKFYGYKLTDRDLKLANDPNSAKEKKVKQYDKDLNYIRTFKSVQDAGVATGLSNSMISSCCNHKRGVYTAGGYIWRFEEDPLTEEDYKIAKRFKYRSQEICQYTLDGKFIKEWKCAHQIFKTLGYDKTNILDLCRNKRKSHIYNGYIWKYKDDPINENDTKPFLRERYHLSKVTQFDGDGKFIQVWDNISEVTDHLKVNKRSLYNACKALDNKELTKVKNYIWKFGEVTEDLDLSNINSKYSRPVKQIKKNGTEIVWKTIFDVSKNLKYDKSQIYDICYNQKNITYKKSMWEFC